MPLTKYELLVGSTSDDLQNKVRQKQSTGYVVVYGMFQRGGYYCQAVGKGTIDVGMVTQYQIVSSANIESFSQMVSDMLPDVQPIGTPVVYNSPLFQVMGVIEPFTSAGGKFSQLQVADGYVQWKYNTDTTWNNLISLNDLTGASVDMRVSGGAVQWKRTNQTTWTTLVNLDQLAGPANTISIGTVSTLAAGSPATATITGTSPNQVLNIAIPAGNDALLSMGTVTTLAAGSQATASISNGKLNLGIPQGLANTLSIGTVSAGSNASASITGASPSQVLNLTLPRGTNSVMETITGTVVTAGTAVPLTFTKTYAAPPVVIPIPQWNGSQMITGGASSITTTGCTFTVMQSRGTLLLTSGPFENAAAGVTFRLLVIGN